MNLPIITIRSIKRDILAICRAVAPVDWLVNGAPEVVFSPHRSDADGFTFPRWYGIAVVVRAGSLAIQRPRLLQIALHEFAHALRFRNERGQLADFHDAQWMRVAVHLAYRARIRVGLGIDLNEYLGVDDARAIARQLGHECAEWVNWSMAWILDRPLPRALLEYLELGRPTTGLHHHERNSKCRSFPLSTNS